MYVHISVAVQVSDLLCLVPTTPEADLGDSSRLTFDMWYWKYLQRGKFRQCPMLLPYLR